MAYPEIVAATSLLRKREYHADSGINITTQYPQVESRPKKIYHVNFIFALVEIYADAGINLHPSDLSRQASLRRSLKSAYLVMLGPTASDLANQLKLECRRTRHRDGVRPVEIKPSRSADSGYDSGYGGSEHSSRSASPQPEEFAKQVARDIGRSKTSRSCEELTLFVPAATHSTHSKHADESPSNEDDDPDYPERNYSLPGESEGKIHTRLARRFPCVCTPCPGKDNKLKDLMKHLKTDHAFNVCDLCWTRVGEDHNSQGISQPGSAREQACQSACIATTCNPETSTAHSNPQRHRRTRYCVSPSSKMKWQYLYTLVFPNSAIPALEIDRGPPVPHETSIILPPLQDLSRYAPPLYAVASTNSKITSLDMDQSGSENHPQAQHVVSLDPVIAPAISLNRIPDALEPDLRLSLPAGVSKFDEALNNYILAKYLASTIESDNESLIGTTEDSEDVGIDYEGESSCGSFTPESSSGSFMSFHPTLGNSQTSSVRIIDGESNQTKGIQAGAPSSSSKSTCPQRNISSQSEDLNRFSAKRKLDQDNEEDDDNDSNADPFDQSLPPDGYEPPGTFMPCPCTEEADGPCSGTDPNKSTLIRKLQSKHDLHICDKCWLKLDDAMQMIEHKESICKQQCIAKCCGPCPDAQVADRRHPYRPKTCVRPRSLDEIEVLEWMYVQIYGKITPPQFKLGWQRHEHYSRSSRKARKVDRKIANAIHERAELAKVQKQQIDEATTNERKRLESVIRVLIDHICRNIPLTLQSDLKQHLDLSELPDGLLEHSCRLPEAIRNVLAELVPEIFEVVSPVQGSFVHDAPSQSLGSETAAASSGKGKAPMRQIAICADHLTSARTELEDSTAFHYTGLQPSEVDFIEGNERSLGAVASSQGTSDPESNTDDFLQWNTFFADFDSNFYSSEGPLA